MFAILLIYPEYVGEGGESERCYVPQTSQLNRSDEGRGLLGPWSDSVLERSRVAGRDIGQQRVEKPARGRTNSGGDSGRGEPKGGHPWKDPWRCEELT